MADRIFGARIRGIEVRANEGVVSAGLAKRSVDLAQEAIHGVLIGRQKQVVVKLVITDFTDNPLLKQGRDGSLE